MTRPEIIATIALAVLLAAAAPAAAQSRGSAGAIDVAVGALYMNRSPLASGDAKETTPTGGSFSLFSTSTTLAAMTGGELHVGVHMTRHLQLFGAASFGSRQLRIEATNDKENAAAVTAAERLQQFTFTGGALWFLSGSRVAPFLSARPVNCANCTRTRRSWRADSCTWPGPVSACCSPNEARPACALAAGP